MHTVADKAHRGSDLCARSLVLDIQKEKIQRPVGELVKQSVSEDDYTQLCKKTYKATFHNLSYL